MNAANLNDIALTPAQQLAMELLVRGMTAGPCVVLQGGAGTGKSTIVRYAHAKLGGAMITMKDFVEAMTSHPLAIEETFQRLVLEALAKNDIVFIDDLHLLMNVVAGHCYGYPRSHYLEMPLATLTSVAAEGGKKLIFVHDGHTHSAIRPRCYYAIIPEYEPQDYRSLCESFLGMSGAMALDYQKIHRFAPRLNAHQIRLACAWVAHDSSTPLTTERFIDYLRSQRLTSNVDLAEVQAVELHDLKGIDDIIEALEANIIIPLEDDELAAELGLQPKRGVLLAGPPGTGKTSIGRALAHRLKGKFFLIDGTFISGTPMFFQQVHQVFEAAKNNAPSIIFIDDSDVIFESGNEMGLYRYLLTMLDGLESPSAGRVCLMMTAMDIGALPPAMVRSGRIELWLETRLPGAAGRREILRVHAAGLPQTMGSVDLDEIAGQCDGLTGADIKRLVDDAKVLYAHDRSRGRATRSATEYCLLAGGTVGETSSDTPRLKRRRGSAGRFARRGLMRWAGSRRLGQVRSIFTTRADAPQVRIDALRRRSRCTCPPWLRASAGKNQRRTYTA